MARSVDQLRARGRQLLRVYTYARTMHVAIVRLARQSQLTGDPYTWRVHLQTAHRYMLIHVRAGRWLDEAFDTLEDIRTRED